MVARPKKSSKSNSKHFRQNALLLLTVGAVFLGIVFGCSGRLAEPSANTIRLISFPGEVINIKSAEISDNDNLFSQNSASDADAQMHNHPLDCLLSDHWSCQFGRSSIGSNGRIGHSLLFGHNRNCCDGQFSRVMHINFTGFELNINGEIQNLAYIITYIHHINIKTGIILVMLIHPGNPDYYPGRDAKVVQQRRVGTLDTVLDLIR
jgi:hypothetical protein